MIKKLLLLGVLLMTGSACVSRTITKEPGLKDAGVKNNTETKIVWFWDKDF